ncbi:hypothetical protein PCIT_a2820 [Pseudoalteromonas citrea]|uniref:AB hydrolase-1 domain-containing protein n=2 Tax=Pseudoalteromonas citrea TaxID=43655 RepID=A0AAD4FRI0_9GAMM|nr:alpha/beta hydrolase [Pseudoalteromonas citrea]KAF7769897.1 hypothetical protein PCIT_a2820 [Pseudoalteromonas citrea]
MPYLMVFLLIIFSDPLWADEHDTQFVDINGNKLAYVCKGSGELTVLLMAGMGLDAHASFKNTFHNLKPNGYQLCFYDRAGTGQSGYTKPKVRGISELADELTLLTKTLNWKNLVLVPHSFGGFVARAFTHKNPNVVKGIVFIDSAHESWFNDMKHSMSADGWKTMEWIMQWERNTHSFEDFAEASSHSSIYTIPQGLPITVLSRGLPHVSIRQTKMRYSDVDAYTQSWDRSQTELNKISTNSKSVKMAYASHLFDETDPWIAIKYIEEMAKAAANTRLKMSM